MAQAKAKSNSVVTTQWSGDILEIEVLGAGTLMFDRTLASAANREAAEKHGWTQRLCDRAAKGRDTKTGQAAPAAVKFGAIESLLKYYESGDVPWKMSGGAQEGGLLFEALCEFRSDKTAEQIKKFLGSRTPKQLSELRASQDLMPIINRLRAERAGDVDTAEALGDLDAMEGDEAMTEDEEIAKLMAK